MLTDICELVEILLTAEGFEVTQAKNGQGGGGQDRTTHRPDHTGRHDAPELAMVLFRDKWKLHGAHFVFNCAKDQIPTK